MSLAGLTPPASGRGPVAGVFRAPSVNAVSSSFGSLAWTTRPGAFAQSRKRLEAAPAGGTASA